MASDIVPIELGLTEGNKFTLWAPRWREGDDEWEAFLGLEDDLYGFDSVADLVAFVRSDEENDLDEHPAWETVVGLKADELVPTTEHTYDVIGVPELASGTPDPETIAELEDVLEIVRIIGEVCDIVTVQKLFNGNPILGAVTVGTNNFVGKDGRNLWERIGRLIDRYWDDVLDAIDEVITTPKVDKDAAAEAQAEIEAAAPPEVDDDADGDIDPDLDDDADLADLADLDDDVNDDLDDDDDADADSAAALAATDADTADELDDDEDDIWAEVGIDPIQIVTSDGEYYSLRCYLGDDPVFLGEDGKIFVFRSTGALARYLADDHEHDLAEVSTFGEIRTAATDGSLEVTVHDENVYVLPGLEEDIADGPRRVDRKQLALAVELITDAGHWADDDSVGEVLAATSPLGWFVDYATNPDPKRLAPSAPFDNESEAWRALVHDLEGRLATKG